MAITFFKVTKIIQESTLGITTQELVNEIRPYEACVANMDVPRLMDGTGKDCVGALGETAITLRLVDGWRFKFADRAGPCFVTGTISGGNLVATNCFCCNPIAPSNFVTTILAQALSAGTATDIRTNMTRVKRYLTNKKTIVGTALTIRNDDDSGDSQNYTLDDGDNPKSQTPV